MLGCREEFGHFGFSCLGRRCGTSASQSAEGCCAFRCLRPSAGQQACRFGDILNDATAKADDIALRYPHFDRRKLKGVTKSVVRLPVHRKETFNKRRSSLTFHGKPSKPSMISTVSV